MRLPELYPTNNWTGKDSAHNRELIRRFTIRQLTSIGLDRLSQRQVRRVSTYLQIKLFNSIIDLSRVVIEGSEIEISNFDIRKFEYDVRQILFCNSFSVVDLMDDPICDR